MNLPTNDSSILCPKCGTKKTNGPKCLECGVYYKKVFREEIVSKKPKTPVSASKAIVIGAIVLLGTWAVVLAWRTGNSPESAPVVVDKPQEIGGARNTQAQLAAVDARLVEDIQMLSEMGRRYTRISSGILAPLQRSIRYGSSSSGIDEIRAELMDLEWETRGYDATGCANNVKTKLIVAIQKAQDVVFFGSRGASYSSEIHRALDEAAESVRIWGEELKSCLEKAGI